MAPTIGNRPRPGLHNDKVRSIFGMAKSSRSSTSDSATMSKMANNAEDAALQSAANDNRMLHEMQSHTKILKDIRGSTKGFGLTDFLVGSWLSKLMGTVGRGVFGGLSFATAAGGAAIKGVTTILKSGIVGTAKILRDTIMGILNPIKGSLGFISRPLRAVGTLVKGSARAVGSMLSSVGKFFTPLTKVAQSVAGLFHVPALSGMLGNMLKLAPRMLKTFGSVASKLFLPLTAILGIFDGFSGFANAESILDKKKGSILDRINVGIFAAINGLLLGIPDFIADKLGHKNLANAMDHLSDSVDGFMKDTVSNVSNFIGGLKDYIPEARTILSKFGGAVKDKFFQMGDYVKGRVLGLVNDVAYWIPRSAELANKIGQDVVDAVYNFGDTVKDNVIGLFTGIGEWTNKAFTDIKDNIGNWFSSGGFFQYGGWDNTQLSAENAPSQFLTQEAPAGMMSIGEDSSKITVPSIPTEAVVPIVLRTSEEMGETFQTSMDTVVENTQESMEDMTQKVGKNWVDSIKEAMGNMYGAGKVTADALARAMPDIARYYGMSEAEAAARLGSSGVGTTSGVPYMPGNPGQVQSSDQSLPGLGSGSVVSSGTKVIDASMLEAKATSSNRNAVMAAMVDRAISRGLTPEQAIGLVSNFRGESLDPTNNTGDSGKAFGIAQWHPDRQAKLREYAKITGKNYMLRATQVDFSLHEMGITNDPASTEMSEAQKRASGFGSEAAGGRALQSANTPAEAASAAVYNYERPLDKAGQASLRGGYANELAQHYNSLPDKPTPAASSTLPKSVLDMRIKTPMGTSTIRDLGITSYEQLQQSGIEAFAGGKNDPTVTYAVSKVQEGLGNNFDRVTAQNDIYHQGSGSSHTKGVKADFTVKGIDPRAAMDKTVSILQSMGLVHGKDFNLKDEYNSPSARATGGHIDMGLTATGRQKVEAIRAMESPEAKVAPSPRSRPKMDPLGSGATIDDLIKFRNSGIKVPSLDTKAADSLITQSFDSRVKQPTVSYESIAEANRNRRQNASYFDPELMSDYGGNAKSWMNKDGTSVTSPANIVMFGKGNDDAMSEAGVRPQSLEEMGKSVARGIVDSSMEKPRQPTIVPMDSPSPISPTPPTPVGSNISKNPSGTPKEAVSPRPDMGSIPTIDEMSLLYTNSDLMQ